MKTPYTKAFTLVELIVVITILSILSTVGFVMYTDYLTGVRDSSRIQQMTEIHKALTLYGVRSRLPLPQEAVTIVSGASAVGTQGYANQGVLDSIKYSDGGVDPKTKSFYTYFVSKDRRYSQLLGYFEENRSKDLFIYLTNSSYASGVDYSSHYPQVIGSELGILIQDITQIPIQEIETYTSQGLDILTATGTFISYATNSKITTGGGSDLIGMVPGTNCKKILDSLGNVNSGIYKINPTGVAQIEVYCDMDLDGGGWTLIARSIRGYVGVDRTFGWLVKRGNVYDDSIPYSMGPDSQHIVFSELARGIYLNGKALEGLPRNMLVDRNVLIQEELGMVSGLSGCISTSELICAFDEPDSDNWGFIDDDEAYRIGNHYGGYGTIRGELTIQSYSNRVIPGEYQYVAGMIFIR